MQKHEKLHLLDFSLSLILPYPVRNSLPFTSFRSVTVGSGRDFLEGDTYKRQSRGLLKPADPAPRHTVVGEHGNVSLVEVQAERAGVGVVKRGST